MKVLKFPSKTTPFRIVVPLGGGKRKSLYFATPEEAHKKLRELKKYGPGILRPVDETKAATEVERDSRHWQYLADKYGLDAAQIAEAMKRHVDFLKLNPATVREAVEVFYAFRQTEIKKGKIGKRTLQTDKSRLVHLVNEYGRLKMTDLTRDLLVEFCHGHGDNARNIYKALPVFLGWAVSAKYLLSSPLTGIEPDKEFGGFGINNEFYPVPVFRRMLRIAAGLEPINPGEQPTRDYIDLLPIMVLGGFAGMRTKEIMRYGLEDEVIRWSDLHFTGVDKPHLQIREEVAKHTRREDGDARPVDFPVAVDAMRDWLGLCPRHDRTPYICRWTDRGIYRRKRDFSQATGIKFVDNAFRNSFGTYLFSYAGEFVDFKKALNDIPGLGYVAKQMGTSEKIAKRHYVQSLPTGSGSVWFGLRPFEVVEKKQGVA
jgi:hypothetical protein